MTYRQKDRPHGRTDGQWETDRQTYWQTDKQTQTDGKQTDGLADRQTRQRSTNYRTAWLIDRSAQKILQRNLLQIPLSMQKYRFVSLTWRLWKNENPVIAGVTFLTKLAIALKKPNEEHMLRYNQRVFSENLAPWPVEVNFDIFFFLRRNNSSFRSQSNDSTQLQLYGRQIHAVT